MIAASRLSSQGLSPDLNTAQAGLVCAVVLAAHAAGAMWLWHAASAPPPEPEPATIAVVMLSDAEPAMPVVPLSQPAQTSLPAPAPSARNAAVRAPSVLAAPTSHAPMLAAPSAVVPNDVPAPVAANAQATAQSSNQVSSQVNAQANSQPSGQTQSTAAPPQAPAGPKTLPASAVRYLNPPVLSYPRVSRELGESGVVRLRVLVDEQGRPREVEVAKSSSYPRLDQAAVQAMRAARFQPHIEDGQPRMVWVVAPLNFQLDEL